MKRLTFSIVIILISIVTADAQIFGGRIGYADNQYNFDTLTIQNEMGVDTFQLSIENRGGTIYAGVFFRVPIGAFYLEAEPMLTSFSYDNRLRYLRGNNGASIVKRERFNTIDVGLTAGLRFWKTLRVQGGVTGQIWTNYISEVQDFAPEYNNDWDKLVQSVHGGIGLDIVNMTLDFNYERTLKGFGDNITFYNQSYNWNGQRNRFIVKLGVRIGGQGF